MTVFDYAVVFVVAASLLLGLWRGVVGEVIALTAWIGAFLAAKWWGPAAGEGFSTIAEPSLRVLAGWLTVFVGVLVAMALLRLAVQSMLKALGLTLTDRLLGVIFGVARGLAIVLVLVALGGMTSLPREKWWSEAYFSPPLQTAVLASKPWLPAEVAKRIRFG
ncbi:MAG: CvpA family protein [Candidatus Accumulibacter sp.]|uniref:CvpA family protein n=1 Tax=Accumulibacter sp. TaxID=2053492 RepID=UPI00287AC384|nr:CvpA family protein [Accumulibacter sp.]MDS4016020.1 CvpA family protein [Accumulibacter sp.]